MEKEQPPTSQFGAWRIDMRTQKKSEGPPTRDLPHRNDVDWGSVASRVGWLTWEDCEAALPGTCEWLALQDTASADHPQ